MGRIPDEDVQRVRDATDVVALISESLILKKKGRLYWGLCPFHGEKTPSFKVDPGTQLWHCFGCGEGGDAFGFIMRQEHLEFPDAVRSLADRARVEITEVGGSGPSRDRRERLVQVCEAAAEYYHKVLVGSKEEPAQAAREYLAGREFGIDVAKRFEIGYAPGRGALAGHLKNLDFTEDEIIAANLGVRGDRGLRDRFYERVMFPIRDLRGRVVAFGGRIIGQGEPKYLNTSETPVFNKSRNLYAIDVAKNEIVKAKEAVVVEGYTDVIALHEAGLKNVVATLGTALTRDHVRMLGRFASRIVCLFDADEAGLRAAERVAEYIDVMVSPERGRDPVELLVATMPEGTDPADHVGATGEEGMREVLEGAVPLLRFVLSRRLAAHDLDSVEGRARALSSAAAVLASVKGTLLAQDYGRFVADELRTDHAKVQAAIERAQPEFGRDSAKAESAEEAAGKPSAERVSRRDAEWRAQMQYIALVANAPELRDKARDVLAGGLLESEPSRLLGVIADAGAAVGTDLVSLVMKNDEGLAGLLGEASTEDIPGGEVLEAAQLLHRSLKEFALKREINELKRQVREPSAVKEGASSDDVFKRVVELEAELHRLRDGSVLDD